MKKLFNNQKVIRFTPTPNDHHHIMWNNDALDDALLNLTAMGFKMYMYLGMQKDKNKPIILSRADAMKALSISEGTYHRVIKELKDKRYLIKDKSKTRYNYADNSYIFLEDRKSKITESEA